LASKPSDTVVQVVAGAIKYATAARLFLGKKILELRETE
jgi:hypothetical protein